LKEQTTKWSAIYLKSRISTTVQSNKLAKIFCTNMMAGYSTEQFYSFWKRKSQSN